MENTAQQSNIPSAKEVKADGIFIGVRFYHQKRCTVRCLSYVWRATSQNDADALPFE